MVRPQAAADVEEGQFLFSAGDFTAYRGYEDLIEAVASRRDRGCDDRVLLAGGPIRWLEREQDRVEKLIAARGVGDRVTLLGRIPSQEMAWCYRHCKAMVMTSRIEACPNVTLEAMTHGCTIISTTNLPMPEMFGDVAMYYDAGRSDALAVLLAAVAEMTGDERTHRSRATADRARECFSWDRAAAETLAQLRLAIQAGKP
jgi:glycosyltransferase involved in cell wall biosynthesis